MPIRGRDAARRLAPSLAVSDRRWPVAEPTYDLTVLLDVAVDEDQRERILADIETLIPNEGTIVSAPRLGPPQDGLRDPAQDRGRVPPAPVPRPARRCSSGSTARCGSPTASSATGSSSSTRARPIRRTSAPRAVVRRQRGRRAAPEPSSARPAPAACQTRAPPHDSATKGRRFQGRGAESVRHRAPRLAVEYRSLPKGGR